MNKKSFVIAICCVFVLGMASLASAAQTVVYGAYSIDLPEGYTEVGRTSVGVKLGSETAGSMPGAAIHTKVFAKDDSYILLQNMGVTPRGKFIRPLEGAKEEKWGQSWRKGTYLLDGQHSSREFDSYLTYMAEQNKPVASAYEVEMYDHLVGVRGVARVLVLTPANGAQLKAVPSTQALYTVDDNK